MLQIVREQFDGALAGGFRQRRTDLPLNGGSDQTVVSIAHGGCHVFEGGTAIAGDHLGKHIIENNVAVHGHRHLQAILRLAPIHSQHPMGRDARQLLAVVEIHFVGGIALPVLFGNEKSVFHRQRADLTAVIRIVGDILGDDIAGTGQSGFSVGHALFLINILLCSLLQGGSIGFFLGHKQCRQRLQSPLTGNGGSRLPLGAEGTVDVVDLRQGGGRRHSSFDLLRQFALLADEGQNFLPTLLQIPQIGKTLCQGAKLIVVQTAGGFLAVTGNKRHGIAVIQQLDCRLRLGAADIQFTAKYLQNFHM